MDSAATNTRERVAVSESDEPAVAANDPAETPRLTLAQRMAGVREESYGIGKTDIQMQGKDNGPKFTIKGHTVEAVLAEIRPLLAKYEIGMTPCLVERAYAGNRCDIIVDFEFEALDDVTDRKVVRWAGCGTDNGDKAFSKAGTNALKEMLKKLFLVTDRDDAKEETESVEHQTEGGGDRRALEEAQRARKAAIQQWATTFKAALENAPTDADVDRLKRENKTQLESDDLPDVTRQFFNELIAERKAETADADAAK